MRTISATLSAILTALLCFSELVSSRIYHQTTDAIVIEVDPKTTVRNGRYLNGDAVKPSEPFQAPVHPDFSWNNFKKSLRYKSVGVPASTYSLETETKRDCWLPDGKIGSCGPARLCYPNDKLRGHSSSSTCRYLNSYGAEDSGVCCPRPQLASVGFPGAALMPYTVPFYNYMLYYTFPSPISLSTMYAVPPTSWPWLFPQFPTALASTNPSSSSVSETTSASTSTATTNTPLEENKPSTTTAHSNSWIQPDEPTTTTAKSWITTSPWWTPEPTTTTAKSSITTSPWWVPESTTTHPAVETNTASTSDSSPFRSTCGAGPYKAINFDEGGEVDERIVGGSNANKNAWPFVVSIVGKGRHFCGGSLLDSTHVLTAAHCIAQLSAEEIKGLELILGLHTIRPMDSSVQRRKLRRITRHKNYDVAKFYNDVAILTMDKPVEFSASISPVCLPSPGTNDLFTGKEAIVVGWGAMQEDGKLLPTALQQVSVKIKKNDECKTDYGSDAPGGILDYMLCAASPNKDSCMGDSGGPLVIQPSPGSPWTQIGVVSWGIGCARPNYPGVYVRLTSFMDWIRRNLN